MGSPEFAVPTLRALAGRHDVMLVVTQPDKPAGRGGKLTPPAIKVAAGMLGLPVIQPRSVRTPDIARDLAETGAELAVVVAYGKILPAAVLTAFPRGCVNVHGSILPAYRGAAPVQRAIIDGLVETGVSIMQLDEGMDTGPVYATRAVAIGDDETAGELMTRLAPIGADALLEVLDEIAAGTAFAMPQSPEGASHAPMLTKVDGYIDFAAPARAVAARIRGVDPWPGAVANLRGERIKLFRPRVVAGAGVAGEVIRVDGDGVVVAAGDGAAVGIRELQAPARKRVTASQFSGGRSVSVGDRFERVEDRPS
jgi:methionyl-tRNA formyltransferase